MGARRCTVHGIHYPADWSFQTCPVCKFAEFESTATDYVSNAEPDEDYAERARQLIEDIKLASEERELIPTVSGKVKVRDGEMWVSAWDVFPKFGKRLCDSELFRIGQQVFEVLYYLHVRREYLVRPFSLTLSEDELRRLADG